MNSFYKLLNTVQQYAWGSTDGIASVTGQPNPEHAPMAELWMGTHLSACSKLENGFSELNESFLDIATADMKTLHIPQFAGLQGLPFLFKLLSAASPLSLQVHPSLEQAKKGFDSENAAGIPLDAANRNYRDPNHKPEIMAALTPFKALCGFRPVSETIHNMTNLGIELLSPIIEELSRTRDYRGFIETLLSIGPETAETVCQSLRDRTKESVHGTNGVSSGFMLALSVSAGLLSEYPRDIGVLAPFYLNILDLHPGEALYLPAGNMHAYLEGTGFELMANSDNVLRGGLTPKYIDIPELLSILDTKPYVPNKILPEKRGELLFYPTPAPDFQLGKAVIRNEEAGLPGIAPTIMICTDGILRLVDHDGDQIVLNRGEVCYIRPSTDTIILSGTGECWFATLPDPQELDR